MNTVRTCPCNPEAGGGLNGGRRSLAPALFKQGVVTLGAALLVVGIGVTGLLAQGPDSTKPGLREGLFVPGDTTRRAPSPVAVEALQQLQQSTGKAWGVKWDKFTGLPSLETWDFGHPYPGDAVGVAATFLNQHKEVFLGIADTAGSGEYSFGVQETIQDKLFTSVIFNEFYRGVKVYEANIAVWLTAEAGIVSVHNPLRPMQLADVTPTLTPAEVEEVIRRLAAPDTVETGDGKMELVIYPSAPPRLAYQTYRRVSYPGWQYAPMWHFLIDAKTGAILSATGGPRRRNLTPAPPVRPEESSRPRQVSPAPVERLPDTSSRPSPTPKPHGSDDRRGPDLLVFRKVSVDTSITPAKGNSLRSGPQAPTSIAHFYEPNMFFAVDWTYDEDDDGHPRLASVEWDADTYAGSSVYIYVSS